MAVTRVVLVGFMGAGKSTTGPKIARALNWEFIDLDDEIERRHGRSPASLLHEQGEAAFRRMESDAARAVLAKPRITLATGGGWGAQPGHLAGLDASTFSVWLKVDPATAVARIASARNGAAGPAAAVRPLLDDLPDPRAVAEALLKLRTPFYQRARATVDTDGKTPERVAQSVLAELRRCGVG